MIEIRVTEFTTFQKVVGGATGILAVYGLLTYRRIALHLRDQHPETWAELGAPAVFGNHTSSAQYLLSAAWRKLGDANLERLVPRWRLSQALFLVGIAVLIIDTLKP